MGPTSTFPLYCSLISIHLLSCYFFSICLQPNTFKFHFIPHLFPLTFFYFHPLYFFPLYQTDPRRNNEAGKFIPTYYTDFCILSILNWWYPNQSRWYKSFIYLLLLQFDYLFSLTLFVPYPLLTFLKVNHNHSLCSRSVVLISNSLIW